MMKLYLKDAKILANIFEAIGAVIEEARVNINAEGLEVTSMDGSHICLVSLDLKKADFDVFEIDKAYELGLNIGDVIKILKRKAAGDGVTLEHDPKDKRLIITLKKEGSKKARKFTISLIDIDAEKVNMDSLHAMEFDNEFNIALEHIDQAIKDAEIFSEVLQWQIKDQTLIFKTEGSIGDMEYQLEADELASHKFTANCENSYAIQFLKSILKMGTISDDVLIKLKDSSPLSFKFNLFQNSKVEYFLAPRVEEEPLQATEK